eukprot:CAMPEP_0171808504 /NCGR_PEP_ID=MMETSP0991-20121206/76433_1 /TAXON_ID=483369 /ORGANISM="non described non described, Strain CCMP2098" /LENGTH=222 /DNA_ID=CAMNT_0012421455 /DNA_START=269 /DNA_END=938 /DNA_ORIENTATION=-
MEQAFPPGRFHFVDDFRVAAQVASERRAAEDPARQLQRFGPRRHRVHTQAAEEQQDGVGALVRVRRQDQVFHPHGHVPWPELALPVLRGPEVHLLPQPHLHHDALLVSLRAVLFIGLEEALVVVLGLSELEQPHHLPAVLGVLRQVVAVAAEGHVAAVPNQVHKREPLLGGAVEDRLQEHGGAVLPTHPSRADPFGVQALLPRLELAALPLPELRLRHVGKL